MTLPDARSAACAQACGAPRYAEDSLHTPAPQDPPWFVDELRPAPAAEEVFVRLSALPHCLYLDSARRDPELGRYSFVTADPFEYFEIPVSPDAQPAPAPASISSSAIGSAPVTPAPEDPLAELGRRVAPFSCATIAELPPFQGGAAGLLSYDFARRLERLPPARRDEFGVPAMAIGLYDVVVAFDHFARRAWIISQGFPELEPSSRRRRAVERAGQFHRWLDSSSNGGSRIGGTRNVDAAHRRISPAELAPQYNVAESFQAGCAGRVTSNFSGDQYIETVARAIEYIRSGDVFQVNLAQRLLAAAGDDSVALYLRLRERNPAPLAGYFDLGEFQIVSASPERFLRVVDSRVEARPIKGTRRRIDRPEADLFAGDELRQSEKDNAENVMIVDLLRNDLARVCRPESVVVSELCRLEAYEFVQHLVSVVRGELRPGIAPLDLVRAAFPGGSITGAPKIRAMQIIAELEPTARGAYCGGLGYLGFDGSMDMNILIRTITAGRGWWQMPVGGGIVAQSDPQREYEETWHKAEGLLRSIS